MDKLPENWESLSHQDQYLFFARHYMKYIREGETDGLYEWAPQDVRNAYEKFLMEEKK